MINFYKVELERLGVELKLGAEATAADVEVHDASLLATGIVPSAVPEGAIDAVEMLSTGQRPAASEATVFGDTEIAMFAALWLAEQGVDVTLSSPSEIVGLDTNDMQRDHLLQLFDDSGINVTTEQLPPSEGTVVWAQDYNADDALSEVVDLDSVREIGTRFRGGRMFEAAQSGYWTAAEV